MMNCQKKNNTLLICALIACSIICSIAEEPNARSGKKNCGKGGCRIRQKPEDIGSKITFEGLAISEKRRCKKEGKGKCNEVDNSNKLKKTTKKENTKKEIKPKFMFNKCIKKNQFALTFDDGPNEMTISHLDYFKKTNIKVAFFFMANRLHDKNLLKIVKRAYREGHIIASHNYFHTSIMKDLKPFKNNLNKKIKDYFGKSTELFLKKLGKAPRFMRPPYGDLTDEMAEKIYKLTGVKFIFWNLDSRDWLYIQEGKNVDHIFEEFFYKMVENPEKSYISLEHDKGTDLKKDLERLDIIIRYVLSKGFKFVSLDECLGEDAYFK